MHAWYLPIFINSLKNQEEYHIEEVNFIQVDAKHINESVI